MGVPGCPEFAFCTASMASVRIVLTHSSSSVERSVATDKGSPRGVGVHGHATGRRLQVRPRPHPRKAGGPSGVLDLPMCGRDLSRSLKRAAGPPRSTGALMHYPGHPLLAATLAADFVTERQGAAVRSRR